MEQEEEVAIQEHLKPLRRSEESVEKEVDFRARRTVVVDIHPAVSDFPIIEHAEHCHNLLPYRAHRVTVLLPEGVVVVHNSIG